MENSGQSHLTLWHVGRGACQKRICKFRVVVHQHNVLVAFTAKPKVPSTLDGSPSFRAALAAAFAAMFIFIFLKVFVSGSKSGGEWRLSFSVERYQIEDMEILFDCAGRDDWGKFSFPVWYGIPVKIKWRGYRFDFNLRGGWKWITGGHGVWPDAQEMLKRTDGNGLIYYGVENYASDYDLIKNFYIPYNGVYNFDLFPANPLKAGHVKRALRSVFELAKEAGRLSGTAAGERARDFLLKVAACDREGLADEAELLYRIMGTNLPVLPPDTIDVDYEVIPLIVADGCDYNCRFCTFTAHDSLQVRSKENIRQQISSLKDFYGEDLINYNSILLGQNDALAGGEEILITAASLAYEGLNLASSFHKGPANLFFFGSVDPFLKAKSSLFDALNNLPFRTSLNIGLESFDQETLSILGKPLSAEKTKEAFRKMMAVNRGWERVTVSCNFVLGGELPPAHKEGIKKMLSEETTAKDRGTAFLSPLFGRAQRRRILNDIIDIKRSSPLPVFIYLAQRL
ncbi:MAG: radical SAM protein [Syntrophales bacterium]